MKNKKEIIKRLFAKMDEYTFIISVYDDCVFLSVEPETRRNGTQTFDGKFHRYYSKEQYAKSALTKHFFEKFEWKEEI